MKFGGAAVTVNAALALAAAFALFPLLWMVSVSFMQPGAASSYPPPLLPADPTLGNYHELFARAGMGGYLLNSAIVACGLTVTSVFFNLMAGYAFAKLRFAGREALFKALLAALIIPGQVAMMPLFLMLKTMGLVNTWAGVIVPGMAGVFGIYLVRQYARSVPDALLEAARIDGAGELRIFFLVVLPLLKPALVAALVYSFVRSMTTVSAVIFLVTAENELATTYIIGRVGNGDYGVALAYCTVLIVAMSLATALIQWLVGERQLGRRIAAAT